MLGNQVTVLTLKLHHSLKQKIVVDGVEVIRVAGVAPSNNYFLPSLELTSLLNKIDADIIHVHNIGALTVPVTVFSHAFLHLDSRLIVSPHHHEGGSTPQTRLMWKFYKPLARKTLQLADKIHAVSLFESKLLQRDFGVEPVIIPNGVSDDALLYEWNPPEKLSVVYAGRIEEYKQVHTLAKAVSRAQKILGEKITFRIVGNGSYLSNVMDVARSLKLEVEYYDFLPRTKYLELLSNSNLFANLSLYEAFSITTAEALAIGMPVVVSKPWGYNFYNYNVRIVSGDDFGMVGENISEMFRKHIRNLKKYNFTWKKVSTEIFERLYN